MAHRRRRKRREMPNDLPDAIPGESRMQTLGRRGGNKTAQKPGHLQRIAPLGGQIRRKATITPQGVERVTARNAVTDALDGILARINA